MGTLDWIVPEFFLMGLIGITDQVKNTQMKLQPVISLSYVMQRGWQLVLPFPASDGRK